MTHHSNHVPIIEEKDFTPEKKFEFFQKCNCSNIIYEDIKNWFHENPKFQKYYKQISNYDILSYHIDFNSTKDTFSKLFQFIFKTKNSASNAISLQNSWEETQSWMATRDSLPPFSEELKESYNNINNYIPYYRPWYNSPCKNCIKLKITQEWEDTEDVITYEDISCDTSYFLQDIINSCMITFLFEIFTHKQIIEYTRFVTKKKPRFMDVFKTKLDEFSQGNVLCNDWKGSNYYYKKMFYKSIVHHSQDFDSNILKYKNDIQFDLLIYGHPKASHGLAYEGWLEIQKIYSDRENKC